MPPPRIISYRPRDPAVRESGKLRRPAAGVLCAFGAFCLVLFGAGVPFPLPDGESPAVFIAAMGASPPNRRSSTASP